MPHRIMKEQDEYAKLLQNAMELCNYDKNIRSEVLDWFRDSILPFLRPGSKTKWIPRLTHHNSPFEPSINTSGDGPTNKTVRFTIEAIGSRAGMVKDKWNQDVQMEVFKGIKGNLKRLDLELFNHFSKAFFVDPKDEWREFQPFPKPSPACFLAFDIDPSKGVAGIGPTAYLFPQLKSSQTGISPGSLVEESILQLHDKDTFNILPALEIVMEYLQEPGSVLTLNDVEMIGFNCTAISTSPRITIYAHCWRNTFEAAEDVYTLGGLLPENITNLDALEEFWKLLFHDEYDADNWKCIPLVPIANDPRSCFIYSFELTPGEPVPTMKVYFPMWCFAASDEDLRRRLDSFFGLKGWDGLVGTYDRDLETIFPSRDKKKETGLHTYVSYARSKEGRDYVTVYWAGEAVQTASGDL